MSKEEQLIEFGKKLKKIRQAKKFELKKVVEQTKININYLKNFEEGKFNFLPELYVRSFLKLYLQQLEEDASSLLDEYDAIKSSDQPKVTVVTEPDLKDEKKSGQVRSQIAAIIEKIKPYIRQMNLIWISIAGVIVFLVIYSLAKDGNNQPIVSAGSTSQSVIEPVKYPADTVSSAPAVEKIVNQKKELNLELKVIERTWLQISVDDSVAADHIFESGMARNWRALNKFQLHIGNAAGVRLILNGQDLGRLGNSGQVIKIDLTENGLQNSSL